LERAAIWLTFDPDGTIGGIQWLKFGSPPSEIEIQQHLRDASRVTWERKHSSQEGELDCTKEQNRKTIFDANKRDNRRGTWFLTITTS
jgi:hypothetical protein